MEMTLKNLFLFFVVSQLVGCTAIRGAFESPQVRLVCNSEFARAAGLRDGRQGDSTRPGLLQAPTCEESAYNDNMFRNDYLAGFDQGASFFCSDEGAASFGREKAEMFSNNAVVSSDFELCDGGRSRYAKLAESIRQQRLGEVCSRSHVSTLARADARRDKKSESELKKFSACGSRQSEIELVYLEVFGAELAKMREEQRLAMEQERLRMERERLAMERERLEMEKQASRLASARQGLTSFVVDSVALEAVCVFDEEDRRANVIVRMQKPQLRAVTFSGKWTVTFFDQSAARLSSNSSHEFIYIYNDGEDDFRSSRLSRSELRDRQVAYCQAVYE